jgi:hypothetical protein
LIILRQTRQTHFGAWAWGEAKVTKSEHFLKENSSLSGTRSQKNGLIRASRFEDGCETAKLAA